MDILEMSPEDIEKAFVPKKAFDNLTRDEAVALCRKLTDQVRYLAQRIDELQDKNIQLGWSVEYYGSQVWEREQAERSAQGIFS